VAFEHVSADARRAGFFARRASFLANPSGFPRSVFDWSARMYPGDVKWVSVSASAGGDGSQGNPWRRQDWVQAENRRTVFVGHFANSNWSINITADNQTLDFRLASWALATPVPASAWAPTGINGEWACVGGGVPTAEVQMQLVVNRRTFKGLSRTMSREVGALEIAAVDTAGSRIQVASAWALQTGELVAYVAAAPASGLTPATRYYVRNPENHSSSTGLQYLQLAAAPGGPAVALNDTSIVGGWLFTLHTLRPELRIPQEGRLAVGEFAWQPWDQRIVARPAAGFGPEDEILLPANNAAVLAILGRSNVHVLGGHFYASHRGVLFDNASNGCGAWGVTTSATMRGIVFQTQPANCVSWFCEGYDTKYAIASEEFANGEPNTRICDFYAHETSNWLHSHGDRQAIMLNPASDGSVIGPGLIENHGVPSLQGIPYPASQINSRTTWGAVTNDSSSQLRVRDIYFYRAYGDLLKINSGSLGGPIDDVICEDCVFDYRDRDPVGMGTAQMSVWAQAIGFPLTNVQLRNNLILLDDIGQYQTGFSAGNTDRIAAGVVSARQSSGETLNLVATGNVVYGGYGADSTLYLTRNNNGPALGTTPAVTADNNLYCSPRVENLHLALSTAAGDSWDSAVNLVGRTPMPAAGVTPTWTCAGATNDANSQVLTEKQMAAWAVANYAADGRRLARFAQLPFVR
jgi:hypothetical protein